MCGGRGGGGGRDDDKFFARGQDWQACRNTTKTPKSRGQVEEATSNPPNWPQFKYYLGHHHGLLKICELVESPGNSEYVVLPPSKLHNATTGKLAWSTRYGDRSSLQHRGEVNVNTSWVSNGRDIKRCKPTAPWQDHSWPTQTWDIQTEHVQEAQQQQQQGPSAKMLWRRCRNSNTTYTSLRKHNLFRDPLFWLFYW